MKLLAIRCARLMVLLIAIQVCAASPFPMPLPDFSVMKPDGTKTTSTKTAQQGKWLLVYTQANCVSCDRFLRVLTKADDAILPSHLVIVVGGEQPNKLAQFAAQFPDLAESSWLADPSETGTSQLQVRSMPVIFGLNKGTIAWSIVGVPSGDSARFKAILKNWLSF